MQVLTYSENLPFPCSSRTFLSGVPWIFSEKSPFPPKTPVLAGRGDIFLWRGVWHFSGLISCLSFISLSLPAKLGHLAKSTKLQFPHLGSKENSTNQHRFSRRFSQLIQEKQGDHSVEHRREKYEHSKRTEYYLEFYSQFHFTSSPETRESQILECIRTPQGACFENQIYGFDGAENLHPQVLR